MADTWYAWAPIHHKGSDGKNQNLKPGDTVPNDLLSSMDEETVEVWKADGVIRTDKFPDDVPPGLSVRTHLLRKANEAYERAAAIGNPQPAQVAGAEAAQQEQADAEAQQSEQAQQPTQQTPQTPTQAPSQ